MDPNMSSDGSVYSFSVQSTASRFSGQVSKNKSSELSSYNYRILTTSLAFIVSGVYCNYVFLGCDYIRSSQNNWSVAEGFLTSEFVALLFGTICFPSGLLGLLVFAIQESKQHGSIHLKLAVFVTLFIGSLICAGYAYDMGHEILECGILFCMGSNANDTSDRYGYGAPIMMGTLYFFLALLFAFIFGYVIFITFILQRSGSRLEINTLLVSKPLLATQSPNSYSPSNFLILAIVFGLLLPFTFFLSISLPSWWNQFTRYNLEDYLGSKPNQAYGYYWSVQLSNNFIVKIFPDIMMYYGSIYLVVIIALLAEKSAYIRQQLTARYKCIPGHRSVAEVLMLLLVGALVIGQFIYFSTEHCYELTPCADRTSVERTARAAGLVAVLVMGLLILPVTKNSILTIVFDMSWEALIEYHRLLAGLFYLAIVAHVGLMWKHFDQQDAFPHDILAIHPKWHGDNFTIPLASIVALMMTLLMGVLTLPCIRQRRYDLFQLGHALVPVVFIAVLWHATMSWYYLLPGMILYVADHIMKMRYKIGYVAKLVSLTNHVMPGKGESVVEIAYRVHIPCVKRDSNMPLSVHYEMENPCTTSGQLCFLNIPCIGPLQWHPFTVSSLPIEDVITHHIKVKQYPSTTTGIIDKIMQPATTWTQRLSNLADKLAKDSQGYPQSSYGGEEGKSVEAINRGMSNYIEKISDIVLSIDGPYGRPLAIHGKYSHVLFVAGGIGITPMQAHFRWLCQQHEVLGDAARSSCNDSPSLLSVKLVWSTRSLDEAYLFVQKLNSALEHDNSNIFEVEIYVTKVSTSSIDSGNSVKRMMAATTATTGKDSHRLRIIEGTRPQFTNLVNVVGHVKRQALVYACGPQSLVDALDILSIDSGVDFRHETFIL